MLGSRRKCRSERGGMMGRRVPEGRRASGKKEGGNQEVFSEAVRKLEGGCGWRLMSLVWAWNIQGPWRPA
jgi:hypothetical protein